MIYMYIHVNDSIMTDTELFIENNIRDFNDILSVELQFF